MGALATDSALPASSVKLTVTLIAAPLSASASVYVLPVAPEISAPSAGSVCFWCLTRLGLDVPDTITKRNLPLHAEYEPHWILCTHTVPNQQRANGMCVFGDGDHWNTSYLKFNQPSGSNLRGRVMVACRNAIVPSRDNFLAD